MGGVWVIFHHIFFSLATVNNAGMNTGVHASFQIRNFFLRVIELCHVVVLFSVFWEHVYSFLQWLHQFTIPPIMYEGPLFSISLPTFFKYLYFKYICYFRIYSLSTFCILSFIKGGFDMKLNVYLKWVKTSLYIMNVEKLTTGGNYTKYKK